MQFLKMPKLKEFVSSFCLVASTNVAELKKVRMPGSWTTFHISYKNMRVKIKSNNYGKSQKCESCFWKYIFFLYHNSIILNPKSGFWTKLCIFCSTELLRRAVEQFGNVVSTGSTDQICPR